MAVGAHVIVSGMGWNKQLLCMLALTACYAPPAPDERFEESIIVTTRDDEAQFGTFQTFFVRPDVRVLDDDELPDDDDGIIDLPESETLPIATALQLVAETEAQLIARGYRQAASIEEAELGVDLVYARNIYTAYYCYYWYDWYYWGYPGYSYYYPYSCDTTSWRSGMLVTSVVDLSVPMPEPPVEPATVPQAPGYLRGLWFSAVYGVETGGSDFLVDRAVDGIDQAFQQSPYFTATP
jgi:hypothetical protein